MGEPNDGAVLRAAMAFTAFVPDGAPYHVNDEFTLTLRSRRPTILQDSEVFGIDVMTQLKAAILKEKRRPDGAGRELTARSVGGPNQVLCCERRWFSQRSC